jgi:hypothetical protein
MIGTMIDVEALYRSYRRCRSDPCRKRIRDQVKAEPRAAADGLLRLLDSGKEASRFFAYEMAREVLPRTEAIEVLKRGIERARTWEERDVPIDDLITLDRDEARYLIPRLRKRLREADMHRHGYAVFALARIGDPESVRYVDRHLERTDLPPYARYRAEAFRMWLAGDHDRIFDAIKGHDHDRMTWLVEAARRIDTAPAREALERAASDLPDVDCRRKARIASLQGPGDDVGWATIDPILEQEFGPHDPDAIVFRGIVTDWRGVMTVTEEFADGRVRVWTRPHFVVGLARRLVGRPSRPPLG